MIGYLDTSAFVPLLIAEPSSESCRRFWDDADTVVSCRLVYVETAAALAQARRLGRLDDREHDASRQLLEQLWPELEVVEVDRLVVERAAELAGRLQLRGYDAVHCAAAEQLEDEDLVAAAGDRRLLDAWAALAIATYDTNAQAEPTAGSRD